MCFDNTYKTQKSPLSADLMIYDHTILNNETNMVQSHDTIFDPLHGTFTNKMNVEGDGNPLYYSQQRIHQHMNTTNQHIHQQTALTSYNLGNS